MTIDRNLNGRRFKVTGTTDCSDISADTVLELVQSDRLIWGEYEGGAIVKGYLVGRDSGDARGLFSYIQISKSGKVESGQSNYVLLENEGGSLRLVENYTWSSRVGSGVNIFDEVLG